MFKRILLASILLVSTPVVASAQGFLLGMMAGGMLFGGDEVVTGGSAAILYSADEETLKTTDPLSVRMAATRTCFHPDFKWNAAGYTFGVLLEGVVKSDAKRERRILQIVRIFDAKDIQCAAIWFAYTEK